MFMDQLVLLITAIDRIKPGILAKLNAHEPGIIHTFLDDIVGAMAAAAASRLAHSHPEIEDDIYWCFSKIFACFMKLSSYPV